MAVESMSITGHTVPPIGGYHIGIVHHRQLDQAVSAGRGTVKPMRPKHHIKR